MAEMGVNILCSKSEFLKYMPPYLRQATFGKEGQFLQAILEIINANIEERLNYTGLRNLYQLGV